MSDTNKLIALDADGVLLNYHAGYAKAWARAFGDTPDIADPAAYTVLDRYGLPRLDKSNRQKLRDAMNHEFWSSLPPIEGALEACHALNSAGFELVCVSAIKDQYRGAREQNLKDIGFPLKAVYAAPKNGQDSKSPKADTLENLNPVAFVDDYAPYLEGVPDAIHKALILRQPNGSPNKGPLLALADSSHADLLAFSTWWLERTP